MPEQFCVCLFDKFPPNYHYFLVTLQLVVFIERDGENLNTNLLTSIYVPKRKEALVVHRIVVETN